MKKVLFTLIALLFAFTLQAQTISGYFTETTQGQVNAYGQKGYAYGITASVTVGGAAYSVASKAFGTGAAIVHNSQMGKKVLVGISIPTAYSDVAATLVLQISFDNVSWYDLATLDSDTTPNVTGVQTYLADFSSTYAPYARMIFNAGKLTINTTGRIKFFYSIPK